MILSQYRKFDDLGGKMKKPVEEKYFHWGWTAFFVVAASITWFFLLYKFPLILDFLSKAIDVLNPFIFGFVMAYLMLPIFNRIRSFMQPYFNRVIRDEKRAKSSCNLTCSILSIFLFVALVSALLSAVIPQLYTSVVSLANNMQDYLMEIDQWIANLFAGNPFLETNVRAVYDEALHMIESWVKQDMLPWMLDMMSGGVLGVVNFFSSLVVGIIIAIYMLLNKDTFVAQGKKMVFTLCKAETGNLVLDNLRFTHKVFGGFISGKLLDSLIIGIITFIGLTILKMPYIVLISVVIGVTNILPYFGPFIGAIPSTLLVLLIDPVKAIYFVIFILILQQFDGNILGPKILGDSIGLSSFWVMFAILVFGGAFGFVGMVVGVPFMAIIFSAVSTLMKRRLKRNGMPYHTQDYVDLEYIDPDTKTAIKHAAIKRAAPESVVLKKEKKMKPDDSTK